jgi:hypothetical protein
MTPHERVMMISYGVGRPPDRLRPSPNGDFVICPSQLNNLSSGSLTAATIDRAPLGYAMMIKSGVSQVRYPLLHALR